MAELNQTPSSGRIRIAFFGRRNAGKSSLINALTSQNLAIVSDVPGTTTDPVSKAMEILPLGPCVLIDTAGLDDEGPLGELRIRKSLQVLDTTDIAILAIECGAEVTDVEERIAELCAKRNIATIVVRTKADKCACRNLKDGEISVSSVTREGVDGLLARLSQMAPKDAPRPLVSDLVSVGDIVVCVCPVDEAAPKGRLILPQQQVIRELIENGASALVCRPAELARIVSVVGEGNIRFVVTDSQAFAEVDSILPKSVGLTSFSILFARQKGDLDILCAGAKAIGDLKDGDAVLIAEGCTHRRQCGDIGSVKIPAWLAKFTGRKLRFRFASGGDFPLDGEALPKLVVHCGGCMLTSRAMAGRLERCVRAGVPIVNYGVAIAFMHGIVADAKTCMVER